MKKILFAFLLSATAGVMSAQTIALEPETLDYGTVAIQSDGYRTFTVKNTGNKALVLSNVKPSCGCTATDFPQTPILPGQTGSITVQQYIFIVEGWIYILTLQLNLVYDTE